MSYFLNALRLISAHKLRAALSSAGILFGSAFLITLFAIYNGYKDYVRTQISVSGSGNIIIIPAIPQSRSLEINHNDSTGAFSALTIEDAESIKQIIPDIKSVCCDISYDVNINYELVHKQAELSGVSSQYFDVYKINLSEGKFFVPAHYLFSKPVCIISSDLKKSLFAEKPCINKWIKCNDLYLEIIGVANVKKDIVVPDELRMLNYSNIVYTPLQTLMSRFQQYYNISTSNSLPDAHLNNAVKKISGQPLSLKKITVHFSNPVKIKNSSEIINRLLLRKHNNIRDFNIIIPEHIIARETWKARMAMLIIAFTSLICFIIGGIAVMNYIIATHFENVSLSLISHLSRYSPSALIYTYVLQGAVVSLAGGLFGIIFGIIFSKLFFDATKIATIVPLSSIFISFAVSFLAGAAFSFFPARIASEK
jgi:putative ABC transport system permease protein